MLAGVQQWLGTPQWLYCIHVQGPGVAIHVLSCHVAILYVATAAAAAVGWLMVVVAMSRYTTMYPPLRLPLQVPHSETARLPEGHQEAPQQQASASPWMRPCCQTISIPGY
jgi:hypothetical protein